MKTFLINMQQKKPFHVKTRAYDVEKSLLISLRAAISRKRQFSHSFAGVDPGFDTLFIIEEQTSRW